MLRGILILVSLAATVAACGGGSGAKSTPTPAIATGQAELQKHESDLRAASLISINSFLDGDIDAFYASFSSSFQQRCPKQDFQKVMALASVFLGDLSKKERKVSITDVSFKDDRALASISVDLGGGGSLDASKGEMSDFWVLEDGKWKADTTDEKPCDLGGGLFGNATPAATGTAASGPGSSRSLAVPLGESVVTGNLRVTVLSADTDAAARLAGQSIGRPTPGAGMRFVLVRVSAEDIGSGEGSLSVSSGDFQLTGSHNVLYDAFDQKTSCGYVGDEIRGELLGGGAAEGYVCFQVPSDETGLVLAVSPMLSFGDADRRYLALR